jgi:phosphopantetheine adenylyltransferase
MHSATNEASGGGGERTGFLFGSFDPVTLGHVHLVRMAIERGIADRIVVLVRRKRAKNHLLSRGNAARLFDLATSEIWPGRLSFRTSERRYIEVARDAAVCIRGSRNAGDSRYERRVRRNTIVGSLLSLRLPPPTVCLDPPPELAAISSTRARAAIRAPTCSQDDLAALVPEPLARMLGEAHAEAGPPDTPDGVREFNRAIERMLNRLEIRAA